MDGNHFGSKKLKLEAGRQRYALAENMKPGQHSLEVVKETYSGPGKLTVHGLEVQNGGLVAIGYTEPRLRIQFYGDSNLAGHSLEHEKNRGVAAQSGCHFTYAGIVARMLDAEYPSANLQDSCVEWLSLPESRLF